MGSPVVRDEMMRCKLFTDETDRPKKKEGKKQKEKDREREREREREAKERSVGGCYG